MTRIALGTDHGGFDAKNQLARYLDSKGYDAIDCGTHTPGSTDYPIYAGRVGRLVSTGGADLGVIICRSGNGMLMVANRFSDVRAALATSHETARLSREHNNANVLVLGCDHLKFPLEEVVQTWLDARFEGGRHERRVNMIDDLDASTDSAVATHRALRAGQSIWLEGASDKLFTTESFDVLVKHYGLRGVVASPAVLNDNIARNQGTYPQRIDILRRQRSKPEDALARILDQDVRTAAKTLTPVYEATGGDDGYVGLYIDPRIMDDEEVTVARGRELAEHFGLPNLMLQIPGTDAGLRAARRLVAAGISIHISGIVSPSHARRAADAYIGGLRDRIEAGLAVHSIRSVVGVPVSPVDALVNKVIDRKVDKAPTESEALALQFLYDKVGLANAEAVYRQFREIFFGAEFRDLARRGAAVQRLMWTRTEVPAASSDLRDTYYAEELIAPMTISLLPKATFQAFFQHGVVVKERLVEGGFEGEVILHQLAAVGIDLAPILEDVRAKKFKDIAANYAGLLATLARVLG